MYNRNKYNDEGSVCETMSFGEKILKYKDDILKDLGELIEIESYESKDRNPLDPRSETKKALNWILKRSEDMGFSTVNVDDFAGHAEYGFGDEIAAVLTHVDVVPACEGWNTDPFKLTVKDGKLFARGVADDKGCAIIALYCLKVLKEENISGKRKLRTIFGSAEETGMEDMTRYFKSQALPDMAFTPDSEYGICNVEKGILQLEVTAPHHNGTTLTEFHSGNAINAVPDKAYVLLNCTEDEDHQLKRLADAKKGCYDFEYTRDGLKIISKGIAAHSAKLERGFNAATHLIRLLAANFGHKVLGSLCAFIDANIGLEINGASIGVRNKDKSSGALTLNVGVVNIESKKVSAKIDIRYPISSDKDMIFNTIKEKAKNENLHVNILNHNEPLYVSEDKPIISILKEAYKNITSLDADLYYTGGGTYARTLGNRAVAFGPVFPPDDAHLHDKDENLYIDKFFLHAQICLEAMYKMMID